LPNLKRVLMFDLTGGATGAKRLCFALVPLVFASLALLASRAVEFPFSLVALAVAFIFCAVSLRIIGPQVARSFRLFRRARDEA